MTEKINIDLVPKYAKLTETLNNMLKTIKIKIKKFITDKYFRKFQIILKNKS